LTGLSIARCKSQKRWESILMVMNKTRRIPDDKRLFKMNSKMNMIYWKSGNFWLGKLLEHPEIMTQGETLEELEENLKDAYLLMAMEDVPNDYETKEIAI
jgi:hypothetical protein